MTMNYEDICTPWKSDEAFEFRGTHATAVTLNHTTKIKILLSFLFSLFKMWFWTVSHFSGVHRFGGMKEKTTLRFYRLKVTEKVSRERETYGDGDNQYLPGKIGTAKEILLTDKFK